MTMANRSGEYGTHEMKFFLGLESAMASVSDQGRHGRDRTVYVIELMQRQRSDGEPVEDDEGHLIGYVVSENEPTSDELMKALGKFNIYRL